MMEDLNQTLEQANAIPMSLRYRLYSRQLEVRKERHDQRMKELKAMGFVK